MAPVEGRAFPQESAKDARHYTRCAVNDGARALALSRWVAVAVLALFLGACVEPPGPDLPTSLNYGDDVPAEQVAAAERAASLWNAEVGAGVIAKINKGRTTGCGIFLVRGDRLTGTKKGGFKVVTEECHVEVMFRNDMKGWLLDVMAEHEIGHALRDDRWHSRNPFSVLYRKAMNEGELEDEDEEGCEEGDDPSRQAIQRPELERVRSRMPKRVGGAL
jgi:hypothetical protein